MKKKIIILVVTTILIFVFTFLGGLNPFNDNLILRRLYSVSMNLLNGVTAFIAIKLTGVKIGIELKNFWQYLIGLGIALTLSLFIAFIPAWCGHSIVGFHAKYDLGTFIAMPSFERPYKITKYFNRKTSLWEEFRPYCHTKGDESANITQSKKIFSATLGTHVYVCPNKTLEMDDGYRIKDLYQK